jgi:hypothetical protein
MAFITTKKNAAGNEVSEYDDHPPNAGLAIPAARANQVLRRTASNEPIIPTGELLSVATQLSRRARAIPYRPHVP